jgi:hypothetical protein
MRTKSICRPRADNVSEEITHLNINLSSGKGLTTAAFQGKMILDLAGLPRPDSG